MSWFVEYCSTPTNQYTFFCWVLKNIRFFYLIHNSKFSFHSIMVSLTKFHLFSHKVLWYNWIIKLSNNWRIDLLPCLLLQAHGICGVQFHFAIDFTNFLHIWFACFRQLLDWSKRGMHRWRFPCLLRLWKASQLHWSQE